MIINDRTMYESTKHQVNDIIKNYDGNHHFQSNQSIQFFQNLKLNLQVQ
jgi:hypothetical protein